MKRLKMSSASKSVRYSLSRWTSHACGDDDVSRRTRCVCHTGGSSAGTASDATTRWSGRGSKRIRSSTRGRAGRVRVRACNGTHSSPGDTTELILMRHAIIAMHVEVKRVGGSMSKRRTRRFF